MLELIGLQAGYGGGTVLWGVDLTIPDRTIVCLLGRNGAGKTTLAGAITGIVRATAGQLRFRGQAIARWAPERRARAGIALVPQGRRVFPELTVAENLRVARFAAARRARRDTLDLVHDIFPKLATLAGRVAGTLSGGEQQMLAMGRALMAEPHLLVLDEPSLGLAPNLVNEMYAAIRRIRDERHLTMLLIEQLVGDALAISDRVAVLEDGRIVTDAAVAELGDHSRLVSAYLGDREPAAAGQEASA